MADDPEVQALKATRPRSRSALTDMKRSGFGQAMQTAYNQLRSTIFFMADTLFIPHDPRFPVGKFSAPDPIMPFDRLNAMAAIAEMPELMREAIRPLTDEQINTPYREGGWTVRQVVHHVADSHMTAFFRVRKALTEEWPEVPGYDEGAFARLHDVGAPIEWSLDILDGLHARWVMLLQSLTEEQWKRGILHAERGKMTLEYLTMLYAWHSVHHVAHITHLCAAKGW